MMNGPVYQIFVLTLPGDERRRAPLLSQLDRLGFQFELFFGVDGRDGLPPAYEAMVDRAGTVRRLWTALTDGEYACAISHQEIYRTVLERDLAGAIILEDDAVLQPNFERFLNKRLYKRHDLILLDHDRGTKMPFAPTEITPNVFAHRVALPPASTTGYTISAAAARKIRKRSLPLRGTADWPCNIGRLDCVALLPRLVLPHEDAGINSHLAKTRRFDVIPQKNQRLRQIFDLDKWHEAVAKRIGEPFDRT